jgi:hypothetical protein
MNRADIEKLMNGGGEGLPSPQHQGVRDPYTGDVGGSIPSSPATPARNEEGFSADTEILTDSGWKLFADLDRTEAVATVNLGADQIEYQLPTAYSDSVYDGEMIALRGKRIDALVTPNLRMITCPIRSIWEGSERTLEKLAGKLTPSLALKSQAKWIGASDPVLVPEFISVHGQLIAGEKMVDRGDLAEFIGWYVTSGSSAFAPTNRTSRTIISQSEGKKADVLRMLISKLPWKFHESLREGSCIGIVSNQRQLYNLVQACGRGSVNKKIPQWVLHSSSSILERFFTGCVHGHRFENQSGHRTIATISRHLADGFQECLVKMGKGTTIKLIQPVERVRFLEKIRKAKLQYHVNEIRTLHTWLRGAVADGGSIIRRTQYSGRCYNVTVPNSILVCRRNLKVFLAGSSR